MCVCVGTGDSWSFPSSRAAETPRRTLGRGAQGFAHSSWVQTRSTAFRLSPGLQLAMTEVGCDASESHALCPEGPHPLLTQQLAALDTNHHPFICPLRHDTIVLTVATAELNMTNPVSRRPLSYRYAGLFFLGHPVSWEPLPSPPSYSLEAPAQSCLLAFWLDPSHATAGTWLGVRGLLPVPGL